MARSFFDKLNTLVKSQINDIVSPIDERESRARRNALSRMDIRRGLQQDVSVLRQRIDDALAYQDELQAKTDKLYAEVADWDAKADQAVNEGRELDARKHISRMQQAQRELEMTEAALTEHRYITQDLINQVNTLDEVVAEAEQRGNNDDTVIRGDEPDINQMGEQLVKRLDDTRKQLSDLISGYYEQARDTYRPENNERDVEIPETDNKPTVRRSRVGPPPIQPTTQRQHPVDQDKVDKDFEARLSRLSKPEKDNE